MAQKGKSNAGIHLFPTFFGLLSGLAETFGGIFILLGLFYRPMALFLVGNLMMAASIELAPLRRSCRSCAPLRKVSSTSASSSSVQATTASITCFAMKSAKKSTILSESPQENPVCFGSTGTGRVFSLAYE